MPISMRHKLIAFAFSIAFLVGGSIAAYSLYVGKRQILSSFEQEAFATSQLIARTISNELYFMDIASIRARLENSRANSKIRSIPVTDAAGVLISDGTSNNLAAGIKLEGNFVDQVLRAEQWKSAREGNIFKVGGPVLMPDDSYLGYVIAEFSFAPVDMALAAAARSSLYITLVATFVGVLFAFFISRRFTRSILSIVQAAEAIGLGKLGTRVQVSRSDELGTLATSVNRMAVALNESYRDLETKINERTRDLEALHRALAPISSSNNVELLQNVVERLRDATHADAALIRIMDRNGEYSYPAHTGFPVSYLAGTRRLAHDSALAECIRSGEPLISPNNGEDTRFRGKRQVEAGFASCAFLPLKISEHVHGLIHLASRTPGYFHEGKKNHLLAIAQQMNLAMENFELLQGVRQNLRRIQALRKIDHAINSTLNLHQVLDILLEKIELFVPYAWATTVRLFNEQTDMLEPVTCRNLDKAEWKAQPPIAGNPHLVFTSGRPIALEDLYADSSRNLELFRKNGLAFYLGVPLIVQGKTVGVLSLYTKTKRAFSEQEIEFFSTLAGQASIAIHNSQLYEAAERRRREAEELARFAESLTENIGMTTIADRIVISVRELTQVKGATLRLTDKDGSFYSIASAGEIFSQMPGGKSLSPGVGLTAAAVALAKPVWSTDIATETRFPLSPETRKFHLESGNRSLLVLPLRAHENVIGTLVLVDRTGRAYSDSEVALLQTFADQAALAVDNARLFGAVRCSLEELQQKTADLEKANKAKDEF